MSLLHFACKNDERLFSQLSATDTGIEFNNRLVEDDELNVLNYTYFYNGGGVAAGDLNNDGLPDLVFTGNMVKNRLYLNKGALKFEDITTTSGIAEKQGWCSGVALADVNADGWLDIYICRSADIDPLRRQNLLYINNKNNTFSEQAAQYGIGDNGYSTQASFFDYDKDNDLDLIVINHSLQQYTSGVQENPALRSQRNPDFATRLYRNDNGHYTNVTDSAGIISNVLSFGLGVAISDLNNDGWPDIYLSNDFNEQDYCFINNGNGTFSEKGRDMFPVMSLFSMGSDAADLNNDGQIDIVTLDMLPESNYLQKMHSGAENYDKFKVLFWNGFHYQYSRNMLQLNNGDGTFSEIGQYSGISNTDWSWAALAADFDNDGRKDLFVTNGYVKDYTDMDFLKYSAEKAVEGNTGNRKALMTDILNQMPTIRQPNYIFCNEGEAKFINKTKEWGFEQPFISAGAAYADLDNDGDLDLVVNNSNDKAVVYRNNANTLPGQNFLSVELEGTQANTHGIGARVIITTTASEQQIAELMPVRGFQSSVEDVLHFGLGSADTVARLEIFWPDGKRKSMLTNIAANQKLKVRYEEASPISNTAIHPEDKKEMAELSILPYSHKENEFNDFASQPLLPCYFSRQGPALAVADINGDKLDDVFVGGALGQPPTLLITQQNGQYVRTQNQALRLDSMYEDVTAAFFDADMDGDQDLLVGSGGYELADGDKRLVNRLYLNGGKGNFTRAAAGSLPEDLINDNAIAVADIDKDGDIDIFNGGHCKPGRFPLASGFQVLINDGKGKFTNTTKSWIENGLQNELITSAVLCDFNQDGLPDLAVTGHWMGIRMFQNTSSKFTDVTESWFDSDLNGLYNVLFVTDANNDGKPDLVAGNQGVNNQFKSSAAEPIDLYTADFDGNGITESIMTYYIDGKPWPAFSRDDLMAQIPGFNKKFLFYADYAKASLEDIIGKEPMTSATRKQVKELSTCIFENTGSKMIMHKLPAAVQWSPVFAIAEWPNNGNSLPRLLLGGNQSYTRIRYGRFNSSYGTLLQNNGNFQFTVLPSNTSGVSIHGDVRQMKNCNGTVLAAINNGPLMQISPRQPNEEMKAKSLKK